MKKKAKRYVKFEDLALQASFLENLRRSGTTYKLNRSGAVAFGEKEAIDVVRAAHLVRDAQFPWYFLKWKTAREAARFRTSLTDEKTPFFAEQHEDGTWFVLRRADRPIHERLLKRLNRARNVEKLKRLRQARGNIVPSARKPSRRESGEVAGSA